MIDSSDGAQREERLLEAWLDAVVAAVPELVVCWSQRGVVQEIETVDTFDARSKFPGTDMLERGTSEMLSWLLRECMDENASYLVMKEKDGYAITINIHSVLFVAVYTMWNQDCLYWSQSLNNTFTLKHLRNVQGQSPPLESR